MPNRNRTPEEAEEIVRELTHARREIMAEDDRAGELEKIIKWAWAFGTVVFAVAVWQTKIQIEVLANGEDIKTIKILMETSRKEREANTLLFANFQTSINSLSKQVDDRLPDIQHVKEMWFMKEHGISNREAFEQAKGYPAPTR